MEKKYYFENEDACFCHPLEYFIHDAKIEKQKEISLIEAIPDFRNKDTVWCSLAGAALERNECKKSVCPDWSKGKGNICDHRGKLFSHGELVTFKVK